MDLVVSNLTKTFYKKPVFSNLNVSVSSGECLGILGPNGSGKTTLLKMISGLMAIDTGYVQIGNENVIPENIQSRNQVYYLGHEMGFYPGLTGLENGSFILKLYGQTIDHLSESFKKIGLESAKHQRVQFYSQGMKQRLKLILASLISPSVLLLDEPHSGLDKEGRDQLQSLLSRWKEDGITRIIVSHDESWLKSNSDRQMHMEAN